MRLLPNKGAEWNYSLTMTTHKPLGTVQVDVDDLWVYYQSIGRNAPDEARAPDL